MKKLILTLSAIGLALPAPLLAEVDPKIAEFCLKAQDFQGCVNAMTGSSKKEQADSNEPKCWGSGTNRACLAKPGSDRFGMSTLVDWLYFETAGGTIVYYEADLDYLRSSKDPAHESSKDGQPHGKYHLVPHKGQKRYVGLRMVERFFDKGSAGSAGTSMTFGSAQTTCNSSGTASANAYGSSYGNTYGGSAYGSSSGYTNCTTTPAPTVNIPGASARPAGVSSTPFVLVWDCKDKTAARYEDGRLVGKWFSYPHSYECSEYNWDEMDQLQIKL